MVGKVGGHEAILMSEETFSEDELNKILPYETRKDKPVGTDFELAKDLMKVHGKTAVRKILVPVKNEKTGEVIGYEIQEAPNLFYEIISEDMTKANLDSTDLAVVRGMGVVSNYTQAISEELDINLDPTQKFLADTLLLFLTSSRSKGGWNAWLSKTDKTISQTSLEQMSKQLQEERKSKWRFW